jgi:hypothetical protein
MQVNSKTSTSQFQNYAVGNTRIQSLTPSSLAKLSGDYFKTMSIDDKKLFSNVQLEAISKEALANGFTGDDIKKINLNLNILGSALSNKVIAKLNSNHFVGMDDKSALNASQLGSINVESWKGFKSEDIASIAVSKIASLGSNFMTGLTLDQFKGNGGVAVTGANAAPARGLKGEQIEKLSSLAMRSMTAAHINGLSAPNLAKLTGLQINSLTAVTVGGINSDQFAKFSATQLNNISHAAMGKVTAAQVSALTDEQIFSLTPAQIGGLSRDGVNGLTKANVTSNFVAADPNAATPVPGVAQTKGLTGDQVSAISPSSISGLSTSVLNQLASPANGNPDSSGLVGSFTNTQIRNFTGNQINSVISDLNHDQMPAVSTPAINSISTAKMADLSVDQIKGLTSAQVSKISLDDVKSMTGTQVAAMSATQVAGFTKTQFAVLYADDSTGGKREKLGEKVSLFV